MPKVGNKMGKKSDEDFLIIKSTIKSNRQDTYEKLTNLTEDLKAMIRSIMYQTNNPKSFPAQKYTSNHPDPITVFPANMRAPPLDGGHSTKIGGTWTLKHEISSPKFYELLVNTELKGDTDPDLKNFYNPINMCLNAVSIIQENLLSGYHSIKRHYTFSKYLIPVGMGNHKIV